MDVKPRELPQQSVVGGLVREGNKVISLSREFPSLLAQKVSSLVVWDSHDGFSFDGNKGSFICNKGKQIKLGEFRSYRPLHGSRLGRVSEWKGQSVVAYPVDKNRIVMESCQTGKVVDFVDLGEDDAHDFCWVKKESFVSIPYAGNEISFWHPGIGYLDTWPLEKFKATCLGGTDKGFMCGTESGHIFSFSKSSQPDFTLCTGLEVTALSKSYERYVLSGYGNGKVKVWDIKEQKCMKTFSGKGRIHSCYMLDNLVVAHCDEGGYRGRRFIWSLESSS